MWLISMKFLESLFKKKKVNRTNLRPHKTYRPSDFGWDIPEIKKLNIGFCPVKDYGFAHYEDGGMELAHAHTNPFGQHYRHVCIKWYDTVFMVDNDEPSGIIIHEWCHLLVPFDPFEDHGEEWVAEMEKKGYSKATKSTPVQFFHGGLVYMTINF